MLFIDARVEPCCVSFHLFSLYLQPTDTTPEDPSPKLMRQHTEKLPAGAPRATHNPAGPLRDTTWKQICLCQGSSLARFFLTPSAQLQNAIDKVCPLSSHTYLSCNQIFSIWRESKCCNCFPKTEKMTLRNISNM